MFANKVLVLTVPRSGRKQKNLLRKYRKMSFTDGFHKGVVNNQLTCSLPPFYIHNSAPYR
jgi:hypothetical protein